MLHQAANEITVVIWIDEDCTDDPLECQVPLADVVPFINALREFGIATNRNRACYVVSDAYFDADEGKFYVHADPAPGGNAVAHIPRADAQANG